MNVTVWLRNQGFKHAQSVRGGIDAWSLGTGGGTILTDVFMRHRIALISIAGMLTQS